MLKAVLLDDEFHCTSTLEILLKNHCPAVEIVHVSNDPVATIAYLKQNKIDVLFLDIEMPYYNGFEVLNELRPVNFKVIFITAYDKFAIKAFRYSAFDYLLKPIDEEELIETVDKLKAQDTEATQLDLLMDLIENKSKKIEKIALPTTDGLDFIPIEEVVRCESDSNYTKLIKVDSKSILVSKTLKELTDVLQEVGFIRVHNSHLVNPVHIKRYIKSGGGFLVLSDEQEIPISRQKREQVLSLLNTVHFTKF